MYESGSRWRAITRLRNDVCGTKQATNRQEQQGAMCQSILRVSRVSSGDVYQLHPMLDTPSGHRRTR
jgi:hypothetical protein